MSDNPIHANRAVGAAYLSLETLTGRQNRHDQLMAQAEFFDSVAPAVAESLRKQAEEIQNYYLHFSKDF